MKRLNWCHSGSNVRPEICCLTSRCCFRFSFCFGFSSALFWSSASDLVGSPFFSDLYKKCDALIVIAQLFPCLKALSCQDSAILFTGELLQSSPNPHVTPEFNVITTI